MVQAFLLDGQFVLLFGLLLDLEYFVDLVRESFHLAFFARHLQGRDKVGSLFSERGPELSKVLEINL